MAETLHVESQGETWKDKGIVSEVDRNILDPDTKSEELRPSSFPILHMSACLPLWALSFLSELSVALGTFHFIESDKDKIIRYHDLVFRFENESSHC